ncbi:hypothetical protein GX50_04642 [[Emmonsia] crescens]|uniref:Major facilitator superfamily (MFS) profile domain-containing protein n=1 Tax=[Emmonsia] crescens TaxID=73230 RepID=A0A2B7ZIA2_9EURO|nr:hypothetical protein GX50_04642 [Emmonsia crescens]
MASTDEKIAEGPSGLGSRQQIPNNLSNPENATEKPPYSIFSPAQKKAITYQTSFSAMFSGLSSFIYYPAIRPLAQKLHVSVAAINLIVSAYFIVAGIFPSVIGDIGDHSGRRIASLLAFTLYPAGFYKLCTLPWPRPWRYNNTEIIVALDILASGNSFRDKCTWIDPIFPERSRKRVGNGSIVPPSWINKSVYSLLVDRKDNVKCTDSAGGSFKRFPNPLACPTTLFHKATFTIITVGTIQYTIFSVLRTSLAIQVAQRLSLNYLTVGLIYLPA